LKELGRPCGSVAVVVVLAPKGSIKGPTVFNIKD
jgi:hypothetical protein